MTKFQKIQKWSSVIPLSSTLFVIVVTYVMLTKYKAKMEYWAKFVMSAGLVVCGVYLTYHYLLADKASWIRVVICGLVLYFVNCYYIEMQIECQKEWVKAHSKQPKGQPKYDNRSFWDRLAISEKIDTFVFKHYKGIIVAWAVLLLVGIFSYIIYVALTA